MIRNRPKPRLPAEWAIYLQEGPVLPDLRGQPCVAGDCCLVTEGTAMRLPERFAPSSGPLEVETPRVIWVVRDDGAESPSVEPDAAADGSPDSHTCDSCGQTCRSAAGLACHVRAKHGGN